MTKVVTISGGIGYKGGHEWKIEKSLDEWDLTTYGGYHGYLMLVKKDKSETYGFGGSWHYHITTIPDPATEAKLKPKIEGKLN